MLITPPSEVLLLPQLLRFVGFNHTQLLRFSITPAASASIKEIPITQQKDAPPTTEGGGFSVAAVLTSIKEGVSTLKAEKRFSVAADFV